MAKQRPAALQLKHCFQTNGLLVNKDWARFFARTEARVGLSIDGPAELHDASRRTRDGRGTHERAMRAVRLLQDQRVGFNVITVLTERALDQPERLFDFYVQNEIREVGFNVEEIEGVNKKSSLSGRNVETKFRRFIKRFFELVWAGPKRLKVRELESAIAHILSDEPVRDEQNLPFAIVSVGYDGMISTFSPELLGARHPRFEGFAFRPPRHATAFGPRARRALQDHQQRNPPRCGSMPTRLPLFPLVWRRSAGEQAVRDGKVRRD